MVDAVGYLVSQYPALSHTFIEREIMALRALGVRVATFSVRPSDPGAPFPDGTRAEAAATEVLQGHPLGVYARDVAVLLVRSPRAAAAGMRLALASGGSTLRARLWQLFYLIEAIHLLQRMKRTKVHRLHVHHANNAADIARLTVAMGNALQRGGSRWSWTLAMHGPTEFLDPAGHDLAAKLRSASVVACISEYARTTARDLVPDADPDHFGIVRMSAPAAVYRPLGEVRSARADDYPLRVLFVGRLVPEKAPDDLIVAVRVLLDREVPVKAVIAGAGPLRTVLEARVEALGLGDAVELVGPVGQADLPGLYEQADVFCLPSLAEGIPVVLMEAMLTELPVVTTPVAGIPELVDDATGVLVATGDPSALADALQHLAADPAARLRLGREARSAVLSQHDAGANARRLASLILGGP